MTSAPQGKANRLANETSPYLLQHADHPVDWYPWSDEAFAAARERDCPIFLSIGYSACHWCHVMAHESFEDASIAEFLNQHFISIKLDREERPEIDQIYMSAVLAQNGSGGWPMSVFLTPEGKPFFAGTYFPPRAKWGRAGFIDILKRIQDLWTRKRTDVDRFASELTQAVISNGRPLGDDCELTDELLANAGKVLLRTFDRTQGGFGSAPKFPHPMDLRLLLRLWKRFDDERFLEAATFSLEQMANGGIFDQLGGGFHRYSTDARWLVPHFEKMLYDNALLAVAYLEAWQATGTTLFRTVVEETLEYVLREMTQPEGGFYSSQDADSEGVEGRFFLWSPGEIESILAPDAARLFCAAYDVTAEGNWEGRSILNRPRSLAELAAESGGTPEELENVLNTSRATLLMHRSQRVAPGRDDKILVSWNGLMIAAMAAAGDVLQRDDFIEAASAACDFLLTHAVDHHGRLLHSWKDGRARFNACLDDYACLIDGLLAVFEATGQVNRLKEASGLADRMIEQFSDPESGGFFYTGHDHETLIARPLDTQDSATPSGNAMAISGLLKLARITGAERYEVSAERCLQFVAGQMQRAPMGSSQSLLALDFRLGPAWEIAILAADDPTQWHEPLSLLRAQFLPARILLRGVVCDGLPRDIPAFAGKTVSRSWTVYPCQQGTCSAPCQSLDELRCWLDSVTGSA